MFAPFADRSIDVNAKPRGRQFFNNPGPTNIPDRVLRAMDRPVMDFLAPEFLEIHRACYAGIKRVFKTDQEIFFHASTGHGAWEAAVASCVTVNAVVASSTMRRFVMMSLVREKACQATGSLH